MNFTIPDTAKKGIDTARETAEDARKTIQTGVENALELTHDVLMAGLGGLDFTTELPRRLRERGEASKNEAIVRARELLERMPREIHIPGEIHIDIERPKIPSVDELRKSAENVVSDARKTAEDAVADVRKSAEDVAEKVDEARGGAVEGIERVLHTLPGFFPASQKELSGLEERVEELTGKVESIKKARARAAAAKKRAAAKSATKTSVTTRKPKSEKPASGAPAAKPPTA
ncbi:MAG: hypothetical protein CME06_05650 [Gemmatimonadetes bacterium]|nr:hypothetical protein [Gemmatimonadota bacterium]